MNLFLRQLVAGAVLLSGGCATALHPLSEVGEIVTDEMIVGDWAPHDEVFDSPASECIRIEKSGDSSYLLRDLSGSKPLIVPIKLVKVDQKTYIEADLAELAAQPPGETGNTPGYLAPMRFERRGDCIAVEPLRLDALRSAISSGELSGNGYAQVEVHSTAQELRKFLDAHSDDAFGPRRVYRRVMHEATQTDRPKCVDP